MVVQADDMARDVRIAVDMNHESAPLFAEGDSDTLGFDEIIRAKLADAIRMVEMEAPLWMLEQGHQFGEGVTWVGAARGGLPCPATSCGWCRSR